MLLYEYLTKKNLKTEWKNKWFVFYFTSSPRFAITYDICGYFDGRPRLNLTFIFLNLTLILSQKQTKGFEDECVAPSYGIEIHNNALWINLGGKGNMNGGNKYKSFYFPFINKEWVRTSILLKDGTWEHETRGNSKSFYKDEWKERQYVEIYDYVDSYDGEIIPTKIYIEEREWRPKWLTWTSLFAKTHRYVDVHFSKECGSRKGSWKGGCIGCGYEMLPNETLLACIKRMEKERKF